MLRALICTGGNLTVAYLSGAGGERTCELIIQLFHENLIISHQSRALNQTRHDALKLPDIFFIK